MLRTAQHLATEPRAVLEAWQLQQLSNPSVRVGGTLPSIPRKVIEKIQTGQYVDFADFSPAKGRIRTPLCSDGQLLLVQVDDVAGAKKLIPDFPTWAQCFAIFTAVLGTYNPALLPDLMAYLSDTATHAKRFKWPSWVIYDQNFWQDLASKPGLSWARVDATIYAQCFMNMASNPSEAWCRYCYGIDHVSQSCPIAPRKHPVQRTAEVRAADALQADQSQQEICRKYNSPKGCRFPYCRFAHRCIICGTPGHSRLHCHTSNKVQDGAISTRSS